MWFYYKTVEGITRKIMHAPSFKDIPNAYMRIGKRLADEARLLSGNF